MPSGRRAKLAREFRPFRLNKKRGLSGSASPLEVSRWQRSRGHLPGLFVDRQIEHRQVTHAPRDWQLGADRPDVLWSQRRLPSERQLHVVERFRIVDGAKALEVVAHVEDPGAFAMPWNALQRYRRVEQGPLREQVCAENNARFFNYDVDPIPTADKPDF